MKSVSFLIGTAAILLFIFYSGSEDGFSFKSTACTEPLTYRIGEIDPRFDLSEEEVKNSLQEAADAWANVVNRPVAEYSVQGEIVVNLVYDARQQLVNEEILLRKEMSSKEQQIRNYESVYKGLIDNFERRHDVYKQQEKRFNVLLKSFNKWIQEKNERGGLQEDEIPEFKKKKANIEYLKEQIVREKNELNQMDEKLRIKVNELNKLVDEKNGLIDDYNKKYSGKKNFVQGIYEERGSNKKIEVYKFLNAAELRLVLAHELGHALGIRHVPDPGAVMFDHTRNQSKTMLEFAEQDKEAILNICNAI